MQRRKRFWVLLGLVVVVLAACLWRFGGDRPSSPSPTVGAAVDPAAEPVKELGPLNYAQNSPLTAAITNKPAAPTKAALLAHRVTNTPKPLKELIYSETAILLRNALFDAAEPAPLEIPAHLKAQGDPGSYVVQARGAINQAFVAQLQAAGAVIISYIPNNAYLVRANEAAANRLSTLPQTLSILPWEPYFKLDLALLDRALKQEPLPEQERLSVVVFPGERAAGLKAIESLGGRVMGEDRSPFGHQIIIYPRADSLVELAQLPIVQSIERHGSRRLANDLSRVRAGVATNTLPATPNYLGLSGSNVMVSINDTGVEKDHPDLLGRVFGPDVFDLSGHGTHVGGTIASSGLNSPPQAPGSVSNATFRGIAPASKLYSIGIDLLTGPDISDAWLQQTVATNDILISNNSWGYGIAEYNHAAASYDAAVRDALPEIAGSTPLIFVFAAGNGSAADYNGEGISGDEISSPGTAKNVITVGAIENLRNLTNQFQIGGNTNRWFERETDSDDQVAHYSSRGNVGVGLEGPFGRFKPDVVAPGSWVVSCRSSQWTDPTNLLSAAPTRYVDQFLDRRSTNFYSTTIPDNAIYMIIRMLRNPQSPANFPPIGIHTNSITPPVLDGSMYAGDNQIIIQPITPGAFHWTMVNTNPVAVFYDLLTIVVSTNDLGDYFKELRLLNDQLKPHYRFDSGTSMAAPVVSGTLALMQEFFEQRLGRTNSPALMKALLINGARSLPCDGCDYDLTVRKDVNDQGWGLLRLTNSIPRAVNGGSGTEPSWPIIMLDQDVTNTLATGESHTYRIQLNTAGRFDPLMVTLVWTDPPGNPVASTKLVNDLDLIVTNIATGDYSTGNNIPLGSDFNEVTFSGDSNRPPADVVNNVENVFIEPTPVLASRYSITVRGRRVNVNSVTGQTNGIRQDYALVIASANPSVSNIFNIGGTFATPTKATDLNPFVQNLSNKVALLNQRVGANSPQLPLVPGNVPSPSHGVTNQWNFYIFNNTNASHTNVAFLTFLSPNLSLPRQREADIDLYVSFDTNLINLDPAVLNASRKSLTRGGTELVVFTGGEAPTGLYYVGVKSEDQQAASFGIFAVAQDRPFGAPNEDGNIPLDFIFTDDGCIPDGSPEAPSGKQFLAIVVPTVPGVQQDVRRVILTNTVEHELGGDLLGTLTSMALFSPSAGQQPTAVLNNHRSFEDIPLWTFIYDDSGEDDIPGSRQSDGPGSLRDFEGRPAAGVWQFTMVDNTAFHVGCVRQLVGMIEPQQTNGSDGIVLTIGANRWRYTSVDVPPGVTNLVVHISHEPLATSDPVGPLDVYVRRLLRPNLLDYDKKGRVDPPGGKVEYGRYDIPGLQSGRYHIGVHNPNPFAQRFRIRIELQYSLSPLEIFSYTSTNAPTFIPDDVTTNFVIGVTNARTVADVKVGVRIDHDRLSDVVLHLVSPEGTRILLTENRGLLTATNYGLGVPKDFIVPFASAGDNNEFRTNINTLNRQGVIRVTYDFIVAPDFLRVYYEGKKIFDSGLISGQGVFTVPFGPGISTFVEVVVNEGGQPSGTQWSMSVAVTGPWNYAVFTDQPALGPPIKFAFPPFSREPTNIIAFSNSFEDFPGIYVTNTPPTVLDGWTVRSNWVEVLTDTNLASTGTNYLALSHGMISRGLTNMQPGHEYIFSFAQRKVSSSPTQSVRVSVPTTATPYANTNPPIPAGSQSAVLVPKVRLCPGQDVTIISTNFVDFGGTPFNAMGDTNTPPPAIRKYGLIGCWSSHPTVLNPRTRASAPFYVGGTNVLIAAPNEPGDYYLFLGVEDDNYGDNTGAFEVELRWAHCQLTTGDYFIGNTVTRFSGAARTNWAAESLNVLGNPTTTNLAFRPDINTTLLLDSIIIDELIPSAHYQSEEPLAPLRGEHAFGEWKLEVRDNRVGPVIPGTNQPVLLSWSLNFVFEDGPQPIPVLNRVPFRGTVKKGQIHYFVVNVPPEVNTNWARVTSSGPGLSGVELLYSPFGLPEGAVPPDPIFPTPDGVVLGLATNYPPGAPIVPGRQYFLAVRNVNNAEDNNYQLEVVFENVPVTGLGVGTFLGTGLPPLPSWLQARNDSSVAVANMHYFSYQVGALASNVSFQVTANQNVHLVARRALPEADHFPRPTFYDYHSTETTAPDRILITSNSIPVSLAPGRWYLGVYNLGDTPTNYTLTISESVNPDPLYHITELPLAAGADSVSTNFAVQSNSALTNFYHFITDNTNAAVLFEIHSLSRDVDLLVRRADLPSRDLYDFSFLSTGSTNTPPNIGYEPIPVRTNIFVPTLGPWQGVPPLGGSGTNWYIGLVNRTQGLAEGILCVKVFQNLNPLVGCVFNQRITSPITPGGPIDLDWDYVPGTQYDVEVTSDLINWTIFKTNAVPVVSIPTNPGGFQLYRVRAY